MKGELREHEESLENLDTEIELLTPMVVEAATKEREEKLGKIRDKLTKLGKAEEAVWSQAGTFVEEILNRWGEYVDVVEERDRVFAEAIHQGTLANDADVRRQLEHLTRGPVSPISRDVLAFVARVIDVTVDPDSRGPRDEHGQRSDSDRRLPDLLPDMRGRLRRLEVSGGVFPIT